MNKYKNLMSNTMVFAIATFSSKLLPFVLLRLYTYVLSPEAYGFQENIVTICNLILPIMYLSMGEAVIRYGLDETVDRRDVFTTGILTVVTGYVVLWCIFPLLRVVPFMGPLVKDYWWLIYPYVIASAMHTVVAQFVRASGLVRLFAIDGIYTTLCTVAMNILLLVHFKLGAPGYVLSIIIADASSALLLFLTLRLHRFFRLRGFDPYTALSMLRYAIPLVPAAVFWWVTNLSDKFFVTYLCGIDQNGLYAVAYKLPNLITLVSMIFTQAWQLSAFTEYKSPEGERFFSNVFKSYYTLVFLAASGLILLCKPFMALMTDPKYHGAWVFSPFLILAVAFSTLVTFLGTVYNAVQKNGMVMLTTFIGAAVNALLNFLLIPFMGPQGAAVATFASFFIVFAIRAVDCQKYLRIRMQPVRILFTLALLLLQIWLGLAAPPLWPLWETLVFLAIVVSNFGYLWFLLRRLLAVLGGAARRSSV